MHPEALAFVTAHASSETVLEFGSRDINGGVRHLFGSDYLGIDIAPGPGVDRVCDATCWDETGFDVVVCCEVLEHTPDGKAIVTAAARALVPGGRLILTCATDPRAPHSAFDGGAVRPDEYYSNVDPTDLADWLTAANFRQVDISAHPRGDLYCVAVKGEGKSANPPGKARRS